jgi:hypothetical protein
MISGLNKDRAQARRNQRGMRVRTRRRQKGKAAKKAGNGSSHSEFEVNAFGIH